MSLSVRTGVCCGLAMGRLDLGLFILQSFLLCLAYNDTHGFLAYLSYSVAAPIWCKMTPCCNGASPVNPQSTFPFLVVCRKRKEVPFPPIRQPRLQPRLLRRNTRTSVGLFDILYLSSAIPNHVLWLLFPPLEPASSLGPAKLWLPVVQHHYLVHMYWYSCYLTA